MATIQTFPDQCGMRIITGLYAEDDLEDQIEKLDSALSNSCQVVLTDIVKDEKKCWAETKAHCYHGPSKKNPNSGNRVKVYIATRATLTELKKLAKKRKKK